MSDAGGTKAPSVDVADQVELLGQGRYAVVGVLGEGSQGQTLEAVDKRDGRLVAIKRFRIKGASSWKDVELAEREARVLSNLAHPLLPRYIEHFEENGALCLVMEKVEGTTLRALSQAGGLDQQGVIGLLNDMADILDYLHSRSPPIIHRDIKPTNIVRRSDGSFSLVDFGSVRDCLKPDGGSTVVGTFGYMAPEQFQGRALPVSDVYGVGATALAMLAGSDPDRLPHQGLSLDVTRALGGQVDARLIGVLEAMLQIDPDQRAPRLTTLLARYRFRMRSEDRARAASTEAPRARRAAAERSHQGRRATSGAPSWQEFAAPDPWLFQNQFVAPLVLLALELGKLATWALFSIFLPTLFGVLSIFFGRSFRRVAMRLDAVGYRGRQAMAELSRRVAERSDSAAANRHRRRQQRRVNPRLRVHPDAGRPISMDATPDSEQDSWTDRPDATRGASSKH